MSRGSSIWGCHITMCQFLYNQLHIVETPKQQWTIKFPKRIASFEEIATQSFKDFFVSCIPIAKWPKTNFWNHWTGRSQWHARCYCNYEKELTFSSSEWTNSMTALLSCPNINPASKNDGMGNWKLLKKIWYIEIIYKLQCLLSEMPANWAQAAYQNEKNNSVKWSQRKTSPLSLSGKLQH